MPVMIAPGHAHAKSRIHMGRLNPMSQKKSLFTLSHKLTTPQTNWPTIEKEAFAYLLCPIEIRLRFA